MTDYVLWSGGADSTYLLYDKAREATHKEPVIALSIVTPNNKEQGEMEAVARKNLKKVFKDRGLPIKYKTIRISGDAHYSYEGGKQHILWLCAAFPFLQGKSTLSIGYIYSDSVWHKKGEIVKAFNALDSAKVRNNGSELLFPIEWKSKKYVLQLLKEAKLIKHVWYCEEPKNKKACKKCECCVTHNEALRNI